jgi:hypothetical protein
MSALWHYIFESFGVYFLDSVGEVALALRQQIVFTGVSG